MTTYSSGKHLSVATTSPWGNFRPSYLSLKNRPNPILKKFRDAVRDGDPYADPESWLNNLSDMAAGSEAWLYTFEQIDHAERVLTRLLALTKGTR